jgi:hypothetical protein
MLHVLRGAAVLATVATMLDGPASAQQSPPQHVRGQITAADASSISVRTRDGQSLTLAIAHDTGVSLISKLDIASVTKGSFVGAAAVPQSDGTLKAQEVLVFPEAMRGTGEGHRPWDLTPDSTMTNAIIDDIKGRVYTLKYKDGQKLITVAPETPIVTTGRGSKDLLKPGAHIFAVARKGPDGGLTAARVAVGKDGLVPPM